VEIPRELTKEERGLLERFAEIRGERPQKGQKRPARLRRLLEK
jgi:hypothetical protein